MTPRSHYSYFMLVASTGLCFVAFLVIILAHEGGTLTEKSYLTFILLLLPALIAAASAVRHSPIQRMQALSMVMVLFLNNSTLCFTLVDFYETRRAFDFFLLTLSIYCAQQLCCIWKRYTTPPATTSVTA